MASNITGREETYLDSKQEKKPIQENPANQLEEPKSCSGEPKNLEQYILDKKPHGWCAIFNNDDFGKAGKNKQNKPNIPNRKGTDKDAEAIRRVFEKRKYTVVEHRDCTRQEMLDTMKEYQEKDHSHMDSFICFILSHGYEGTVLGVDGKDLSIKSLTNCLNGLNCRSLNGKPKLFFIQACQGDEVDDGVLYEKDSSTSTYESDGQSLPITADLLVAYSTTEEYVSLRSSNGSVYIQELCKALEDPLNVQKELINILTIVQRDIANESYKVAQGRKKQMPAYKSQLRKKLILPSPENTQSH